MLITKFIRCLARIQFGSLFKFRTLHIYVKIGVFKVQQLVYQSAKIYLETTKIAFKKCKSKSVESNSKNTKLDSKICMEYIKHLSIQIAK